MKSHKIAASHVYGKLADLLTATLIASGPQSALYVNVREGYLPTALPAALISRSVALTRSANDARLARAVLDFWGRSDVALRHLEPGVVKAIAGFEPSLVVGATYPDTREEDIGAINGISRPKGGPGCWRCCSSIRRMRHASISKAISSRPRFWSGTADVPPAWQQTTLFLFARST